jgi:hypothetical protein
MRARTTVHGNVRGDGRSRRGNGLAYDRYRDWLPFGYRQRVVMTRIADAPGYPTEYEEYTA